MQILVGFTGMSDRITLEFSSPVLTFSIRRSETMLCQKRSEWIERPPFIENYTWRRLIYVSGIAARANLSSLNTA
jgi:hypothetical protein